MRIVIALGGNALLARGDKPDATVQLTHLRAAAEAIAPLTAEHEVLICHGNGPLDDLVAEPQGMIGYWLAQALHNAGVRKPILGLITQTLVDAKDPAFAAPTKFGGPGYPRDRAEELAGQHGWTVAVDGDRWRRVVASPEPVRIIELDSITELLGAGSVVICGGGGGAAVSENDVGQLAGLEAVVDKDYVTALLGIAAKAQRMLVLTDVPAVMAHDSTPQAAPLPTLAADTLGDKVFAAGSMGPKIEASRRFVVATGHPATTASPSASRITSPNTRSVTSTLTYFPSQRTTVLWRTLECIAAEARSARYSLKNPKPTLAARMTPMMIAWVSSPRKNETTAVPASSSSTALRS